MLPSLVIDRRGVSGPHRARSRSEALHLITSNEYDRIELHTKVAGRDDYGVVEYLAATWPAFLQRVSICTVRDGRVTAEWDHASSKFVLSPGPRVRRRLHQQDAPRTAATGR
jgi:hypothetical protein